MLSEIQIIEKSIEILEQEPSIKRNYENAIERLKERLARAKKQNYRMGVLGVTSSGKSTLLNALLGESLLPMDTRPTSSQLVSCGYSAKREAVVYFSDNKRKSFTGKELTINAISQYADEDQNPKNKKNVRQVYLSTPKIELPPELELVDSPGLDAFGFPQHEELTLNVLLPTIDFCIFITTFKTNSDEKMRTILSEIAKSKKPVIVVINMYDAVRPSPDNRRSKEQVADDTRTRVQRIINNSGFSQPQAVPILFFSAKPILLEREQEQKGQSNNVLYTGFIQMIKKMLEAVCQQMDANRFSTLRGELLDIDKRLKTDSRGAEIALQKAREKAQELSSVRDQFEVKYQRIITSAASQIDKLREILNKTRNMYKCDASQMRQTCSDGEQYCKNLVSVFQQYNPFIDDFCRRFNLNASDFRVRTSEPSPRFQPRVQFREEVHTTTKTVDKSGLFAKIGRFFDKENKRGWGRETVTTSTTETVVDYEANKRALIEYVEAIYYDCYDKHNSWYQNTQSQYKKVCDEVSKIIAEIKKPSTEIINADTAKRIESELERLICKIPDRIIPMTSMIESPPNPSNPSAFKVSSELAALYQMSNKIMQNVRLEVFKKSRMAMSPANKTSIVSWDLNSVIQFLYHSFNIQLNNLQVQQLEKTHYLSLDNTEIIYQPTLTEINKYLISFSTAKQYSNLKTVHDYYILVNTVQSGQAESDILGSGILDHLPNDACPFFVVQNGDELFGSGHTLEGIRFMRSLKQKARNAGYIMIEHENPIYQICISEVQRLSIVHQREEIAILSSLQRLDFLYRPEMQQTLAAILRAFADTK